MVIGPFPTFFRICNCDNECYEYSACNTCDNTCYTDTGYGCDTCDDTCYEYSACSCDFSCYDYT